MIATVCAGHSQSSGDTICVPVAQAKKVYAAAAQKQAADSMLRLAEKQIDELNVTLSLMDDRDREQRKFYQDQMNYLREEIKIHREQVSIMEKMIRKEKRKRFWASFAGVLATGLTIGLSTLK